MGQKKIIVVLGAKYEQVPLMKIAAENGFKIVGIDYNESPYGEYFCDHFYRVSYRDENKILDISRKHQATGIGTIGTNDAIYYASKINLTLGLNGLYDSPAVVARASYKDHWRPFLVKYTNSIPLGKICNHYTDVCESLRRYSSPVIIKPSDSSGSKGITVVEEGANPEQAYSEAKKYSTNGMVIVEEYIGHNSFAVESFVTRCGVHLLAIAERKLPDGPLSVGLGTTLPDILPEEIREKIRILNNLVIEKLGITYGPVHIDMVLDSRMNPYVIDVGPRLIAGPNALHIKLATGFDVTQAVFNQIIGIEEENIRVKHNGRYYAHRYITSNVAGKIRGIYYNKDFYKENILEIRWLVKPGDRIEVLKNSQHRYGYVTAWDHSFEALKTNIDRFVDQINIETE